MKKKHKILPALICLLALVLADPYVAYAEKDEPETASKTIKITTKSGKDDGNNADEEDLGPGERSKEDEENHVEKEDGNSEDGCYRDDGSSYRQLRGLGRLCQKVYARYVVCRQICSANR